MKTLFTIGSENSSTDILLLEIGQDHCCYAYLDSEKKAFEFVKYISFDDHEAEEKLGEVLKEINTGFQKVIVCSAYAQALLMPMKTLSSDDALLRVIYDLPSQVYLNDKIPEWQIVAAYSLPIGIHQQLVSKFSSPQFLHVYTPTLKIYNGFVAEDQVDIHFTTQQFRVLVKKGNQIQLAQIYYYKTPLDVVYYLLKIFSEFGLSQSEALLIISGLIDKDSAMFTELHNYFLNLHFAKEPVYSLPQHDYPHYYFTSLYNLASCAS